MQNVGFLMTRLKLDVITVQMVFLTLKLLVEHKNLMQFYLDPRILEYIHVYMMFFYSKFICLHDIHKSERLFQAETILMCTLKCFAICNMQT